MATLEDLRQNIKTALQDSSFSDDDIDAKINQGLEVCALYVLLPELESIGNFTTVPGSLEVAIPSAWEYHRNLYSAQDLNDSSTQDIEILSSLSLLKKYYSGFDQSNVPTGDVEFITTRGSSLVYVPSPTGAIEITCRFYMKPTPLVLDSQSPDYLPAALHEELLESFVLWKCWSIIEDGIEGPKINTSYNRKAFSSALVELDDLIKMGQSSPPPKRFSGWI